MPETSPARRSQREVKTCTECARSKIRCSKTVPCEACTRRQIPERCQRPTVQVVNRGSRTRTKLPPGSGAVDTPPQSGYGSSINTPSAVLSGGEERTPARASFTDHLLWGEEPDQRQPNDETASLDFFADAAPGINRSVAGTAGSPTDNGSLIKWDPAFGPDEARNLLVAHRDRLAWMLNVLHMPTFLGDFERNLTSGYCNKPWLALYYAILSTTLYHLPEPELQLPDLIETARLFYDRSIDYLYQANFIRNHSLTSLQAICILHQLAHHYDDSDTICVLIAAGIRIAQCLNLHRLGPDRTGEARCFPVPSRSLVEREVQKRVWWFLVRQDWLQIPFQNTCQIHPAQFNTPMPSNCFDELDQMIENGVVVSQPDEVFTQNSYNHYLNQVAAIMWKHQDRMCVVGFTGDLDDGLMNLYHQTTWADKELKSNFEQWPSFLQYPFEQARDRHDTAVLPASTKHLACIALFSTAHKILTVHRHFQLRSFRDTRFAYTQLSCISIAERSLRLIEDWPSEPGFEIAKRMWTTSTHIITCCITLVFAWIFRRENALTYDSQRLHHYAQIGCEFIRQNESRSSIARRGAKLLDALISFTTTSTNYHDIESEIRDVIRRVAVADGSATGGSAHNTGSNVLDLWEVLVGGTDLRYLNGFQ